jgi:hypothetical protein
MAAGMSAPDGRTPQVYDDIVVVGGGCYGSYYVRQLGRAVKAGALAAKRIVVVDRSAECTVARTLDTAAEGADVDVRIVVAEWSAFFAEYLGRAAAEPERFARDAIVPSPLMPHLMGEWIVHRARARFPRREIVPAAFDRPPSVPWERAGADGTHYVSFATWTCPVNCVEPKICPHTRDTRAWSMPERLAAHARDETSAGRPVVVAAMFCRHRAYGVGMFDTSEVLDADDRVTAAAERGAADVIVGTVSHCHGALTRLLIPAATAADSPVA